MGGTGNEQKLEISRGQWRFWEVFFNDHLCDHCFTTPKAAHGLILSSARKKIVVARLLLIP